MRVVSITPFLNEARHLDAFLTSVAAQTEPPERAVLVDDGSTDGSEAIAERHAGEHPWMTLLRRPPRPPVRDRLADAPELRAFQWGLEQVDEPWDVVVKLDGDLDLHPGLFAEVRRRFAADERLGITGTRLAVVDPDGSVRLEPHPDDHVRGPNKFYRRACYEAIAPLPAHLGWDTMDDLRARAAGWRTESFVLAGGQSMHLRPTGLHDGRLRAFRRWGVCAWGYGASPLNAVLGGLVRARRPPLVLGGLAYLVGYAGAALKRAPRAEPAVRRLVRDETRTRLRAAVRRG